MRCGHQTVGFERERVVGASGFESPTSWIPTRNSKNPSASFGVALKPESHSFSPSVVPNLHRTPTKAHNKHVFRPSGRFLLASGCRNLPAVDLPGTRSRTVLPSLLSFVAFENIFGP